MKTKAIRLYGVNDLRLEEFELPEIRDDEILAKVVSDSICMSSHKLAMQGAKHKRVRHDLSNKQPIIGHEFCGTIEKVGSKLAGKFKRGDKFAIQPALNCPDDAGVPTLWAPGYSFEYIGGVATYIVIPREVMEMDCLLDYRADNFFMGSLAEPVSCIAGAFHAQYHTKGGSYVHSMGIVEGGSMALLAGVGPMGLGAIDYAIHNPRRPSRLIVTDIDDKRLQWAAQVLIFQDQPGFAEAFMPAGRAPKPGERFRFPEHAATLEQIALSNGDAFYRGDLAGRLEAHAAANGGAMRTSDLAVHRADWVGTIDAGYRNEIGVILHNAGPEPQELGRGLKIAQIAFRRVPDCDLRRVATAEFDADTARSLKGFGSSGA
ncbi:MAG: gamma-glutamyltransferase [Clostridia bacterium]|nr:gamma-glutamyltransferase [Clostridia bacterium]